MDKDAKFDRFIEDFDKSLNTDTSTYKTIALYKPADTTPTSPVPTSPLLTTPTKARRNSISPDDAPLQAHIGSAVNEDGVKPVKLSTGITRSNTMGGLSRVAGLDGNNGGIARQPSRRGLNLGINVAMKQQGKPPSRMSSPESNAGLVKVPLLKPEATLLSPDMKPAMHSDNERSRRRTNSSTSEYDDLNESLRVLAAKEMRVVELREKMKMIQQELDKEEQELTKLRNKVENTIHKDHLSPSGTPNAHNRNKQALSQHTKKNQASKNDSIWSKPVSLLNQFDQILQNEIERLNKDGFTGSKAETTGGGSEDMLNSVSSSLWTFVSDVKQGLLGEEEATSTNKKGKLLEKDEDEQEEEMITMSK